LKTRIETNKGEDTLSDCPDFLPVPMVTFFLQGHCIFLPFHSLVWYCGQLSQDSG